jgi:hypothetical protein
MTEKRELTKPSGNTLKIHAKDETEAQRQVAQTLTSPSVNAALVISTSKIVEAKDLMDFGTLVDELTRATEALEHGDMKRVEAMLVSQAHALQALFASCARRMATASYLDQFQTYGQLALKAQNQCRATLATLAKIKHPDRATFIKNTATHQQINVGAPRQSPKDPGKSDKRIIKHELSCDTGHPKNGSGNPA